MKNTEFFPFERNNYYTGKLLSVRDFRAEQQYLNDKRRLMNRVLMGVGIVRGFRVSRVDGASIVIESGLALDGSGREIVLDRALIKKLSEIDGFGGGGRSIARHVYLCVEYAEEETEPMHGVDDSSVLDSRNNRVREGIRFFLTYEELTASEAKGSDYSSVAELLQEENLEKELHRRVFERIYLARIDIVRWENAYEIGDVTPAPFNQFALSSEMVYELLSNSDILDKPRDSSEENTDTDITSPLPSGAETTLATGYVTVDIPREAKPGQAFYSEKISLGLEGGEVFISLSLQGKSGRYFGSSGVFSETSAYEYAACINDEDKSFKVGVMLKEEASAAAVTINWCAFTIPSQIDAEPEQPQIAVSPPTASLKPGGKQVYKAQVRGLKNRDVVWSLIDAEGGYIDGYGSYTAPDIPGVYCIIATSASAPDVAAKAYVVVENG